MRRSLSRVPGTAIIVGAGPAGTAAAIRLREHGIDVTVLDKAEFPRDKCCGDGLTTGALRLVEQLGVQPNAIDDWQVCHDVTIRSPRGRQVELALPGNAGQFAAIVPRLQFDAALVHRARECGALVREGVSFIDVIRNDDTTTTIATSEGEMSADFIVAADGMWSPVRKSLDAGLPSYLGEWHAFRQYYSRVTGPASSRIFVWFEPDLLPGYAWSFPLPGNRANFGFGILREKKKSVQHMKALWNDLPLREHISRELGPNATPEGRHTAWPIPARVNRATRHRGRVLFTGDAVCATDLLTGEGIGQALLTGILAADAIASSRTPTLVARAYSTSIDRHLLADHRMSSILSAALARPRGAETALRLVDTNTWTRRNFVRWMFEDEARAAAFTPRRWHRQFLKRDGAFV